MFQTDRFNAANRIQMPSSPLRQQEPTPKDLFNKTQTETRQFADDLKAHLVFKNGAYQRDSRAIVKDTEDKAVVTGLLVSIKEPFVTIPVALPVESLTTRSSTVFSLYEGDTTKLTADITFKFKVTEKLSPEDLKSANIDPNTILVSGLSQDNNELRVNRSTYIRGPKKYELDMALPQGGYVYIDKGTATYIDQSTGEEKTLNLSDCRLYEAQIHSITQAIP